MSNAVEVQPSPENAGPLNAAPPAQPTGIRVVPLKEERRGNKADIAVEGDTIDQVYSLEAREAVLSHARSIGLSRPGFSGGCWTEWVGADGKRLVGDEFKNSPYKRCRAHYPVQDGI